jgi:hypothetical protein
MGRQSHASPIKPPIEDCSKTELADLLNNDYNIIGEKK